MLKNNSYAVESACMKGIKTVPDGAERGEK